MDARLKISTVLLVLAASPAAYADRWQSLRDNNPFMPYQPPAPVVEGPPQLELRGVMVEGRVTWFNVYNAETKESAWVRQGEQLANLAVKGYESERETLLLDYRQKQVALALKQSKVQTLAASSARRTTSVASLTVSKGASPPMLGPVLPAAESQRLEQIADQIRQRREERQRFPRIARPGKL